MQTTKNEAAKAAYSFYREIIDSLSVGGGVSSLSFDELNELYNIVLRAQKDEEFEKALAACDDLSAKKLPISEKINKLLSEYSAAHGVDIREELYEIKGAQGTIYFKAQTDRDAHTYRLGDSVTFHVSVRDKKNGQLTSCDKLEYTYEIEGVDEKFTDVADGRLGTLTVTIPSERIMSSSFVENGQSKGILIRLSVSAVGVEEQEKFLGGAVVDMDRLAMDAEKPDDFDEYWQKNIDATFKVSPIDESVTIYDKKGVVVSDIRRDGDTFSREKGKLITEENYFHANKIDREKLDFYHAKGMNLNITEAILDCYDVYELYLKSPGPCPSTLVLSIPRSAKKDARASFSFAGYSAHASSIYAWDNVIRYNVSHHGYWMDASDDELYNSLNRGENPILYSYGKANGTPNSDYNDPYDCYILYMFLRDFQALRFAYELPNGTLGTSFDGVLGEIYSSLLRAWNGEIELCGGSMGGYQAIGVAALAAKTGIPIVSVRPSIPGFCNLSGKAVGGRFNTIFGMKYDKAMPYIDAVPLAEYIDSDVEIMRCGLGDYVCPPAGVIAAYNAMKCKKKINIYQNSTHGYVPSDTYIYTCEEESKK